MIKKSIPQKVITEIEKKIKKDLYKPQYGRYFGRVSDLIEETLRGQKERAIFTSVNAFENFKYDLSIKIFNEYIEDNSTTIELFIKEIFKKNSIDNKFNLKTYQFDDRLQVFVEVSDIKRDLLIIQFDVNTEDTIKSNGWNINRGKSLFNIQIQHEDITMSFIEIYREDLAPMIFN